MEKKFNSKVRYLLASIPCTNSQEEIRIITKILFFCLFPCNLLRNFYASFLCLLLIGLLAVRNTRTQKVKKNGNTWTIIKWDKTQRPENFFGSSEEIEFKIRI